MARPCLNTKQGVGAMAPFAGLTEDMDLVSHWTAHNCLRLQFQGVRCPLLASSGTHTHVYGTHTNFRHCNLCLSSAVMKHSDPKQLERVWLTVHSPSSSRAKAGPEAKEATKEKDHCLLTCSPGLLSWPFHITPDSWVRFSYSNHLPRK